MAERSAQFAPPCEAVTGRFVFGVQTCDEPAVTRVRCPDDACGSRPHSHAACGLHVWRGATGIAPDAVALNTALNALPDQPDRDWTGVFEDDGDDQLDANERRKIAEQRDWEASQDPASDTSASELDASAEASPSAAPADGGASDA